VIYFLEAVAFGVVKVGKSDHVAKRLRQIRGHCPPGLELRLLKVIEGDVDHEAELHRRWAEWNVSLEWFQVEPLRAEIEALTEVALPDGMVRRYGTVIGSCGHEKRLDTKSMAQPDRVRRSEISKCRSCSQKECVDALSLVDSGKAGRLRAASKSKRKRDEWAGCNFEKLFLARKKCVCVDCGAPLRLLSRKHYSKKTAWGDERRCRECIRAKIGRSMLGNRNASPNGWAETSQQAAE